MAFLAAVGKSGPQSQNATTQGALTFGLQRSASVGATVAAVGAARNLLASRGSQAFPLGVVPFPTLPGGKLAPVAGGNSLVVLSTDRCQKEMATEAFVAVVRTRPTARRSRPCSQRGTPRGLTRVRSLDSPT